jgi:hypothetical protein
LFFHAESAIFEEVRRGLDEGNFVDSVNRDGEREQITGVLDYE